MLFSGSSVTAGRGKGVVVATAMKTEVGKIAHMINTEETPQTPLQNHLAKTSKILGIGALIICGIIFILGLFQHISPLEMFMISISLAVAAIPEGLPVIVTIVLAMGVKRMATNRAIIRRLPAVETLGGASVICSDKTGTLTLAKPKVADVICFDGYSRETVLRYAACLEEHFPHSVANAIVRQAADEGITHDELHSKVEYIVAHGIASRVGDKRIVIGSHHFIFEDEHCRVPEGQEDLFESRSPAYSHVFMALNGVLMAIICISDPLRPEAVEVMKALRRVGFQNLVMMTGDSKRTAENVAATLELDRFYAEVLPEEKAQFVKAAKAEGHRVVMVGDGINDSPALSEADAGIAIAEGADIAREIADITISARDLHQLIVLKELSNLLMKRVNFNYDFVVSFNAALIALGVAGILPPATTALLHNGSTIALSLHSMTNLKKFV